VLATLFLGTFVLGSAELLVVGVLDLIATDLQVSIPAAGTLVTAYALAGVALAATVVLVPSVPNTGSGVASQAKHALAPRVLAVPGLTSVLPASAANIGIAVGPIAGGRVRAIA
jgi:hypothetical protein